MRTIANQIIAGTKLDAHGEQNTKEMLEHFARHHAGRRVAMNQQHDMALASPGHMENVRVVPDPLSPGDWNLIADLQYDDAAVTIPVGGFSISFLEVLRPSSLPEAFQVFLPYPHYGDEALLNDIFVEGYVSVGRWAKKSAEPDTVAIVSGVIVAVLVPLWNDVYATKIAPHVSRFFSEHFGRLKSKNIHADFVQHIEYGASVAEVHFIPIRGRERYCFGVGKTTAAMLMVHEYLVALDVNHVPVRKITVIFCSASDKYEFLRIEYADGSLAKDV